MSREVRTVVLAALTLFFYGLTGYFKSGDFIFPFPLNDFIFLAVVIQFAFWHMKQYRIPILLFLITSILGVAGNQVLWEIILPNEVLETFLNEPWIGLFETCWIGGMMTTGIYFAYHQKNLIGGLSSILGVASIGLGTYLVDQSIFVTGASLLVISSLIKPIFKPIQLIWLLFFILELTTWISTL
jgi:hypothetical protein